MHNSTYKKLHAEGLISDATLQHAEAFETNRLFSLFWEMRLLLYLGVLLLTAGLGILVYKNIDTIGHQAVLAFIALVTTGSFYYCLRKKALFGWELVNAPTPFFDYILLLGCLSLLIFLGYLQYAYGVFGDNYGLATFIPMIILFTAAYFFDHLGVLSLAITNLAAWAGIAITPMTILREGNFDSPRLIYTGLLLGAILLAMGHLTVQRRLKPHFEITYTNFGLHLFFIAALAGLFTFDKGWFLWFAGLIAAGFFCYTRAMARRSFYFVVVIILYAYIALCDAVIRLLTATYWRDASALYLAFLYFIGSAIGIIFLLMRINRQLKNP
ncbi:DUF2157 domain-containing protein [Puia sp.]|jgi:hypothetical protein|uniref:DUF2157 domain-containing protein n=1 Tax=Puia sp. TaxID=2045100 RepID=UPI002F42B37B